METGNKNDSKQDITIAVAMHKPYQTPQESMYLPIHVGSSLHPDILTDITQDNTGENISALNPYFSELTAMYWLWKNCDSDYKGLVHYRRHFASKKYSHRHAKNRFDRIIGHDELKQLLQNNSVLVPKKRHYYIETVYSHYSNTMRGEQLDKTREVLIDLAPDYVPAWDKVMRSRSAHIFNMMVMDRKHFDQYCAWLFPILFELQKRLDPANYDAFQARYLGRVSERLFNAWLITNHIEYGTLPTIYAEPVNWWKKGTGFLNAALRHKSYSASF